MPDGVLFIVQSIKDGNGCATRKSPRGFIIRSLVVAPCWNCCGRYRLKIGTKSAKTLRVWSFAGLLECPFAVLCLMVYGKFGQLFPVAALQGLFFCAEDGELFVLHGFIKKTQKTAAVDLSLAYKRMKEIKS
jgi:hypothetical protein